MIKAWKDAWAGAGRGFISRRKLTDNTLHTPCLIFPFDMNLHKNKILFFLPFIIFLLDNQTSSLSSLHRAYNCVNKCLDIGFVGFSK